MKTGKSTIEEFLDALAAKQSTPGGGGAAALTGSQAAALLSMVANFTVGNKKYASVEEEMARYLAQSEALRLDLLAQADADADAFAGVSRCYGMPKDTDEEKAARTAALQAALQQAARVPLETAGYCVEVLKLVAPVAAKGNTNVVSDAATAAYLGYAALQSAVVNVNINLKFIKDDAFNAATGESRDRMLAEAETALEAGKAACREALGIEL